MSYDQLAEHAKELEKLAKRKYTEITEEGTTVHPPKGCYSPAGACTSTHYSPEDYADLIFGGVEYIFSGWYSDETPDPSDLGYPIGQLDKVMGILSEGGYTEGSEGGHGGSGGANPWITAVGPTGAYMQSWTGDAASNYQDYIAPGSR